MSLSIEHSAKAYNARLKYAGMIQADLTEYGKVTPATEQAIENHMRDLLSESHSNGFERAKMAAMQAFQTEG